MAAAALAAGAAAGTGITRSARSPAAGCCMRRSRGSTRRRHRSARSSARSTAAGPRARRQGRRQGRARRPRGGAPRAGARRRGARRGARPCRCDHGDARAAVIDALRSIHGLLDDKQRAQSPTCSTRAAPRGGAAAPTAEMMPAVRVLLIDDDARLAELLVGYLTPQGVALVHAGGGQAGPRRARGRRVRRRPARRDDAGHGRARGAAQDPRRRPPDPGVDADRARRRGRSRGRARARRRRLRRQAVLAARAARPPARRAPARARRTASPRSCRRPGITVDTGTREAWVDGKPVELTGLEIDLLIALLRRAGRVVPRGGAARARRPRRCLGRRARGRRPHLAAAQEARRRPADPDPHRARRRLRARARSRRTDEPGLVARLMSSVDRRGAWRVPRVLEVRVTCGTVELDFARRDARAGRDHVAGRDHDGQPRDRRATSTSRWTSTSRSHLAQSSRPRPGARAIAIPSARVLAIVGNVQARQLRGHHARARARPASTSRATRVTGVHHERHRRRHERHREWHAEREMWRQQHPARTGCRGG